MTAEIISRTHPTGLLLRPDLAPHVTRPVEQLHPGQHRIVPGRPKLRVADLTSKPAQRSHARMRPAVPARRLQGRALWLARLAIAVLVGAAAACYYDLETPDTVSAVAGSALALGRGPIAALRRLLRGQQRHEIGCEHPHLYGPCRVDPGAGGLDVLDPHEYALFVTMRADTGEVRIEHQIGDNARADRDMARLAAEIVDEIGIAAVNRELVLIHTRRGDELNP